MKTLVRAIQDALKCSLFKTVASLFEPSDLDIFTVIFEHAHLCFFFKSIPRFPSYETPNTTIINVPLT